MKPLLSMESKPEPPLFSTLGRFASALLKIRAAISCARCLAISNSPIGGGTLLYEAGGGGALSGDGIAAEKPVERRGGVVVWSSYLRLLVRESVPYCASSAMVTVGFAMW